MEGIEKEKSKHLNFKHFENKMRNKHFADKNQK